MDKQVAIETALEALRKIEDVSQHPPAMIVLPPDAGFISGNSGGFVQLAIASLKAAQGEAQSFEGQPWVGAWEQYDWMLSGLTPDENAHNYLPLKKNKWKYRWVLLLVSAFISIAVLACLSIGAVDIVHSIFR
jgi:hypothetical protein